MRKASSKNLRSDFLVLGSGIAGLTFAIKASSLGSVNIVTKKRDSESSTNYAQGGIASVMSSDDSFASHIKDTLEAGAGLCDPQSVEILVMNGPERIIELLEWGTRFSVLERTSSGLSFELGREGGHSYNRIIHAKDLTGKEIERSLLKKISTIKNIKIFENHTAIDLITEHQLNIAGIRHGNKSYPEKVTCFGAYVLNNENGTVDIFSAGSTFIATGGAGQVYLHTTNPSIATGDGIAMAYRAGAEIADMEFFQFHPTSLYSSKKESISFLISEAVRGEGAILLNSKGKRFMENAHPMKELAPRDIVARAIDRELKRLGDTNVFLDISFRGKDFIEKRFPNIYKKCLSENIDISREPIPVVPAAHYLCGGIVTDTNGKTGIENLYASGESSCTGVHGANRLASNSLLEGIVFSHRSFLKISENFKKSSNFNIELPLWNKEGTFDLDEWVLVKHNLDDIKRIMWDYVGIVRTDERLKGAYKKIRVLADEIHNYYKRSTVSSGMIELRNLATIAKLIIKSAMKRKDSIGLHYNTDHPKKSAKPYHVLIKTGSNPLKKRKIRQN